MTQHFDAYLLLLRIVFYLREFVFFKEIGLFETFTRVRDTNVLAKNKTNTNASPDTSPKKTPEFVL